MNSELTKEQLDLIEILKLLETSIGNDIKKINESRNKLQEKFQDKKYAVTILFHALSIDSIEKNKISENLHKIVAIYLKNIFLKYIDSFEEEDLILFLKRIIELLLNPNKANTNIQKPTVFNEIQYMIGYISSSNILLQNKNNNYIIHLFDDLLKSLKSVSKDNFLITRKCIILICSSLLSNKRDEDNYEEIINNYYVPMINVIFGNFSNYIDQKNNIYNNEFISLLKDIFDGFHLNLSHMHRILYLEKGNDIILKFFREYGLYSYELIQLTPLFDEPTAKKFGKPNPIIIFDIDEKKCYAINNMKSKVIKFISFIIEISTKEKTNIDKENKNVINDQELIDLINKIIYLIIDSFRDILNNKEKLYFIKNYYN